MNKQHGYIIDDMEELAESYRMLTNLIAFKDLEFYLEQLKNKAMKTLKQGDDAEARATWQVVDKLFNRIDYVEKEAR